MTVCGESDDSLRQENTIQYPALPLRRDRQRTLQIANSFAEDFELLVERFAVDPDAVENFFAGRLDRLRAFANVVEIAGPLFDFEDRFVDRFEIDLLGGRLSLGSEA